MFARCPWLESLDQGLHVNLDISSTNVSLFAEDASTTCEHWSFQSSGYRFPGLVPMKCWFDCYCISFWATGFVNCSWTGGRIQSLPALTQVHKLIGVSFGKSACPGAGSHTGRYRLSLLYYDLMILVYCWVHDYHFTRWRVWGMASSFLFCSFFFSSSGY